MWLLSKKYAVVSCYSTIWSQIVMNSHDITFTYTAVLYEFGFFFLFQANIDTHLQGTFFIEFCFHYYISFHRIHLF